MIARELKDKVSFWYRTHYRLTIHDPRYLESSLEDMMIDYYANLYQSDPKAMEEVTDEDFDKDEILKKMANGEEWEDM